MHARAHSFPQMHTLENVSTTNEDRTMFYLLDPLPAADERSTLHHNVPIVGKSVLKVLMIAMDITMLKG